MNQYQKLNQNYINGKWVNGTHDSTIDIINPFDDDVLAKVSPASEDQAAEAFNSAQKAQSAWGKDPERRTAVIQKAIDYFKEHKAEIKDILTLDSGSTEVKAELEANLTIGLMEESLTIVDSIGKFEEKESMIPDKVNENYRLPKGVISSIAPFNFPLYLSMRNIVPALALGNAVVHKPDLQCGLSSGSVIAKAFDVAGIPSDVFHSLLTKSSVIGDIMSNHQAIKRVSFTGSTNVGKHIGEVAGGLLKEASLELGGNGPFCVLSDADVDTAVDAAIFGKYMHQGQICMAINRMIIHEDLYNDFTDKFIERTKDIPYGDPRDKDVVIGPLINKKQMEKSLDNIQLAKDSGYDILLEGKQVGNVLTPTIIGNVENDGELSQTEMFSPIALIEKSPSDEAIIEKANHTSAGLSSSIMSGDVEKAREYALELKFGMTHINDQPVNDEPTAMFGGMRDSGIGRFGIPYLIDEFTEAKWISVQKKPREFPF